MAADLKQAASLLITTSTSQVASASRARQPRTRPSASMTHPGGGLAALSPALSAATSIRARISGRAILVGAVSGDAGAQHFAGLERADQQLGTPNNPGVIGLEMIHFV